jgi:hypothetical protein
MDTKKIDSKIDSAASKVKEGAAKANTLASDVLERTKAVVGHVEGKVDELTKKGEHRAQEAVGKATHALQEVTTKVAHAADEAAHKVAHGAKDLASKIEHAGKGAPQPPKGK